MSLGTSSARSKGVVVGAGAESASYRIGADENGLGARLGPLVVTGVLARVTATGNATLARRLPKKIRADLGDSKALVSHGNVALGEAWARALAGQRLASPAPLFDALSLEGASALREPCPSHVEHQCWRPAAESFTAEDEMVERVAGHVRWLSTRGVEITGVRTSVLCTKVLNEARSQGKNRFVSDLHAMERLVLALREQAGDDVLAVCGKVGGMNDYSRFFGPLSMRLHAVLAQGRKSSDYRFPGIGELRFVRDADAKDPLVMLASLVGKYVRELLMGRIAAFYEHGSEVSSPSGYHDPATARFVDATALVRKKRRIPDSCFERERDPA
jgi:ribonuclease HII